MKPFSFTSFLFAVLALLASGCGYNRIQTLDEETKAAWSEVLSQYQRRADLIPNLVNTVKGYAAHEEQVLREVTEARAKVGTVTAGADLLEDEAAFARFQEAQREMSGALSRLLAISENYPQLKADASFRDLQAQLEGTENRIAVARGRFIASIRDYNVAIRSFPVNITAKIFGYATKPNFQVEDERAVSSPPRVDFSK